VAIHTPEDIAGMADLIAFIAAGRVLAAAPPAEMLKKGRDAEIDRYLGR
jgi:ABC-type multidrug transport system ATPase subunit